MAKPAYMDSGVDANLARLIKDGALFLRPVGSDAPTGADWTPTPADLQLGYYSDDGYTLTPVPGDETNLTGHNGDPLISESAPGWWTTAFAALEGNEVVTSAYFDVEVDTADGSVTVTKAAASKRYDLIAVGLDQKDRLILVHYPNVQIDNSSREALTFNRTTLLAYALTFRTFKGGADAPYHFKAWGFVAEDAPTILSATPPGAEATETVTITGTGLSGVTGVKFGSSNATSFDAVSATEITAVMPAGSAGSAQITVTTPSGTATFPYTRG